ncbi:MAG: SLOG cluster 4 domain-containing protein [Coriobacteriia bacterium]
MRTVIGVMGSGGRLTPAAHDAAYRLGAAIAARGWVLLTGGSACGVMNAASHGAHEAGGLVLGVLKGESSAGASRYVAVAIRTGMGDARNVINVLTSDVVIALPGGAGTLSEVALGLKSGRTVIVLGWDPGAAMLMASAGRLLDAASVDEALDIAERVISGE